jgi:hypothetical protein
MRRIDHWEDIRPGDYWSVHGTAWISRAIRWVTRSYWNHSGQVITNDLNQEALKSIEETPLSNYHEEFMKGNLAVFRSSCPEPAVLYALAMSREKTGQKYAWAGTASLLVFTPVNRFLGWLGRLFHCNGLQLPTPFRKWEKCSELILTRLRCQVLAAHRMGLSCPDLAWVVSVPDQDTFTPGQLVDHSLKACKEFPG